MKLTTLLCVIFVLAFLLPFAGTMLSHKGADKRIVKSFTIVSVSMIGSGTMMFLMTLLIL